MAILLLNSKIASDNSTRNRIWDAVLRITRDSKRIDLELGESLESAFIYRHDLLFGKSGDLGESILNLAKIESDPNLKLKIDQVVEILGK